MRRRPRKGKTVRLCPQCGSSKIVQIAGSILGQVYHCEKCDYVGSLVFETDVPAESAPSGGDDA
jgi:predicted RNA-binding Zn-ribbon protein involved in translation (DUF1610 family)